MADNDQNNDEYEFADLDTINSDPDEVDGQIANDGEVKSDSSELMSFTKNSVVRNSIIVVGIIIVLLILYKIIASFYTEKDIVTKPSVSANIKEFHPPVVNKMPAPAAIAVAPTVALEESMNQKLLALEDTQQSNKASLANVNDKLGGVSTNIDSMVTKMNELTSVITNLNAKIDEQAHEIEQLSIKHEETRKIVQRKVIKTKNLAKYNIQAIIPGRAWLIAKNGATLTVREGTDIAGYGMVKLIDPNQGRVITSSGVVIKFSQDDS